jgi:release factor glutamine methyltransferase
VNCSLLVPKNRSEVVVTIDTFLHEATEQLQRGGISAGRLDVLVLLCDELNQDKAWLFAHGDEELPEAQLGSLRTKLMRRAAREPLAYIRGTKEFFGHNFIVTSDILIPRPETETLVELLLDLSLKKNASVIDVGTGSGAIAISLKLARPELHIYATDISPKALETARRNAEHLHADVQFSQGNLLANPPIQRADCIIANLPYVDKSWERSPETRFEPALALFAGDKGLELIKELIEQAEAMLHAYGFLLLEADPRQLPGIVAIAEAAGFRARYAQDYSLVFAR